MSDSLDLELLARFERAAHPARAGEPAPITAASGAADAERFVSLVMARVRRQQRLRWLTRHLPRALGATLAAALLTPYAADGSLALSRDAVEWLGGLSALLSGPLGMLLSLLALGVWRRRRVRG